MSVQNEELTLRCLAHISFSFFTIRVRARTILILEETEKCTLNFKSYSSYKIIFLSTISFEIPSRADFHCLQGSLLIFFSHLYICRGHTGSFSGTGTKADLDNHSNQMNPNNSNSQPKKWVKPRPIRIQFVSVALPDAFVWYPPLPVVREVKLMTDIQPSNSNEMEPR